MYSALHPGARGPREVLRTAFWAATATEGRPLVRRLRRKVRNGPTEPPAHQHLAPPHLRGEPAPHRPHAPVTPDRPQLHEGTRAGHVQLLAPGQDRVTEGEVGAKQLAPEDLLARHPPDVPAGEAADVVTCTEPLVHTVAGEPFRRRLEADLPPSVLDSALGGERIPVTHRPLHRDGHVHLAEHGLAEAPPDAHCVPRPHPDFPQRG